MGGIFRIGMAVVFGAVLVGAAFAAHNARTEPAGVGLAAIPVGTVTHTPQQISDSDSDGVADWEEILRDTDPDVPDDWEAIEAARAEERASATQTYTPPETLTGRFGQTFFEDYMRLSGGQEMAENDQEQFVLSTVSSLEKESRPDIFTRADVQISLDDSTTAVREYGNALGQLIVDNTVATDDPLLLLENALERNIFSELARIITLESAHERILSGMRSMPVPIPMIEEHVVLLNVYGALLADLRGIRGFESDPLLGLLKAKQYQSDLDTRLSALQSIRTELERSNIVYTNNEYGLFFFILRP